MGATRSKLVGFDEHKIYKRMLNNVVGEQTSRLIAYAQYKIEKIGAYIGKQKTGNLLDSLCWGVSYNGKIVQSGFYREKQAREASRLHEWSTVEFWKKNPDGWSGLQEASEEVNGRELAEAYIQKYGNSGGNGWKVFFAILAPYWGYWEKGFNLKVGFGKTRTQRFVQFAVMTQFYDQVKAELKPTRVRFRCSVAKYTSLSLRKRAERNYEG